MSDTEGVESFRLRAREWISANLPRLPEHSRVQIKKRYSSGCARLMPFSIGAPRRHESELVHKASKP